MKSSDLRRLNRTLESFGRTDDGRLRIRWFDTFDTELRYFVEKDKTVRRSLDDLGGGLYVVQTDWEMHYWGERIGKGWVLACWKPPVPRDQYILRYGMKAPYSARGEYQVIENTKRDENDPPNERNTELLKKLLMDMFYRGADHMAPAGIAPAKSGEILESLAAQYQKKHEATRKQIEDELDDILPAFGKKPGSRGGGVSIGGI